MSSGSHHSFVSGARREFECDYVVAGSGAGGASAAISLARAGFHVIVAEAGPWRAPEDYPWSMHGTMRDMFHDWGTLVATGDSIIPIVQASLVGGTPVINSAIVVRTPGDVLASWRDEHGMGDVFAEKAIGDAQDAIERELQIQETDWKVVGATADDMLQGLKRLGREVHPITRNVTGCKGEMQCLQGCKQKSKQTANNLWLPELIDQHGGTILSCAHVQAVELASGQATGLRGHFRHPVTRKRGADFRVVARRGVVVAASATGSAPLLQRSGLRMPALGKGFRGHPGAGVVGVYDRPVDMHVGPSQATASMHHRLDHGIKLEHLSLPLELFAARVGGAGHTLMHKLDHYRQCAMWVTAVRAEAVGEVHQTWWGGRSVTYAPTVRDLQRLRFGTKLLAQAHVEMGARAVWPGVAGLPPELSADQLDLIDQAPLDNKAWTWVLSHLFGGCVFGADPQRAVVGPDLHVHGVRRLHVVDASALPTTLGVNPQHTIMAVARVTAARLANG
ncbi:MAG: GMC family oxidoreductase [Deltaproteobacteria bacterium]|nr:GMC family oxidoreductase [Deltaproteobacteria bacterium]